MAVKLAPQASEPAVLDGLSRLLAPYGGRDAKGREDQSSHAMLDNEIKEQRVMGTLLPAIFLAVAAFLLHLVLSRLVATQREQIAALNALGYANAAIAGHYLKLVAVIVVVRLALALEPGYEARFLEATKALLLRNMQDVSARNVRIMSTILTLFAAVIAVGVVYNNARIALAERTWELASLLVLGFTRGAVSALLLGELAIGIALALPLGMAMGWCTCWWNCSRTTSFCFRWSSLRAPMPGRACAWWWRGWPVPWWCAARSAGWTWWLRSRRANKRRPTLQTMQATGTWQCKRRR